MVKPDVLLPRLKKLSEYLTILEKLRGYSEEEFLSERCTRSCKRNSQTFKPSRNV